MELDKCLEQAWIWNNELPPESHEIVLDKSVLIVHKCPLHINDISWIPSNIKVLGITNSIVTGRMSDDQKSIIKYIPDSVDEICICEIPNMNYALGCSLGSYLPDSIKKMNIINDFNNPIGQIINDSAISFLPNSLEGLLIRGTFNQSLGENGKSYLPNSLKSLQINSRFYRPFGELGTSYLPESIENFCFGELYVINSYDWSKVEPYEFPNSIKHMTIHNDIDSELKPNVLPNKLETLFIQTENITYIQDNIPQTITDLTIHTRSLGAYDNFNVHCIPPNLQKLNICVTALQKLNSGDLPLTLEKLKICNCKNDYYYNHEHVIPKSVKKLEICCDNNFEIKTGFIPNGMKKVVFHNRCVIEPNSIPDSIETISFRAYRYDRLSIGAIPNSVKKLRFILIGEKEDMIIPHTIEKVRYGGRMLYMDKDFIELEKLFTIYKMTKSATSI